MTDLVSIGFTAETTGLKKAQTELNNLTTAGGKADKQIDGLSKTVGILGAALAAIGTAALAQDVIRYADAWKNVTSQIRQVTDSEKELVSVRKDVVRLANETRTGLAETVNLYAAIDRSTTSLGYSTQQQIELTRTLNNLFVAGGKPASESAGAIRQLSQALESGALRGDEFNSVAEGAPRILDALQMKLKMTRGELREFAATGGITAKMLAEALSDYSGEAQRLADQTEKTFAQSMTLASNNVTQFVGGLDTLNGIINDVGSGIEYASRNIDAIADSASAAATVIGGAYAAGLAKSAAASIEKVSATTAASRADLLALQSAERAAFAEKQAAFENLNRARSAVTKAEAEVAASRAIQAAQIAEMRVRQSALTTELAVEQQRMRAQISDIGRMQSATRMAELRVAETAATRALAAAEAQLTATTTASSAALAAANQARTAAAAQAALASETLTAATVRVTAAQGAASITANALGAAWRFMLGPWGLVITALGVGAAAFALTADNADTATVAINKQIKPVDLLTESYDKMTAAQIRNSKNGIIARIDAIGEEIERLEALRDIQSATADGGAEFAAIVGISADELKKGTAAATATQAAIDDLRQEHARLTAKLKENEAAQTQSTVAVVKNSKELDKLILSIADERKELELGADAFADYALRREAITSGASAGLADQLMREAQAMRIIRKEQEAGAILDEEIADNDTRQADALKDISDRLDPLTALTRKYNEELAILRNGGTAEQVAALTKEYDKNKAEIESLGKETNEWAELTERSIDRIDESFSDVWMKILDGASGVFDSLINSFKRMLAEMAHAAITKPILISMFPVLGGASGAANAATDASSLLSGAGMLGGIGSSVMGLGGLIGGGFGAGLTASGGLLMNGGFGTMFSGAGSLFGSGNIASGLGMAAPLIAAGVLGALGINKLTSGGLFGTSYKTTGQSLGLSLGGGDVSGLVTTEESKKKSLFRGTKRRTTTEAFDTASIDEAFDAISASLADAAERLGISGAEEILKGFSASLNLNIKDMTEQQINDAIQQWVGATTEGMIAAVFGDAAEGLGKAGESALDTLVRVTQNFEAVDAVAKQLGLQFDLTGKAGLVAATNIVELVGGIDALAQLSNNYYQEFYTEAERQAMLAKQLGAAFAELNLAMPSSKDAFRAMVEGIDLTTAAGQELFAKLMALSPAFAELMNNIDATAARAAAEAERAAAEAERARVDAINDAMAAVERAVGAEKALANARLQAAQAAHSAEIERIGAMRSAVEAQYSTLTGNKTTAEDMLKKSFDAEKEAIQNASNLRIDSLKSEIDAAKSAASARLDALNSERSLLSSSMAGMLQLASSLRQAVGIGGNSDVAGALTAARRGDFSLAQSLNVPSITDAGFSDAASMKFAQAVQKAQVGEIASLADAQASEFEQQINAINKQIVAVETGTEATIAAIESQIKTQEALAAYQIAELDKQLNALLGIDSTVLPLSDAIKKYQDAQIALDQFGYESQIKLLDDLVIEADKQLAEAIAQHAIETARLDSLLEAAQAQVNAALGVDTSVKSVEAAIRALQAVLDKAPSSPVGGGIVIDDPRPPEAPSFTNEGAPVTRMQDMQQMQAAIEASARANVEAANILKQIYRGGLAVEVIN